MSGCCEVDRTRAQPCPGCGYQAQPVSVATLLSQLEKPWCYPDLEQPHWFCGQRDCRVIYFNQSGQRIEQAQLKRPVGHKSDQPQRLICYCFGISAEQAESDSTLKQFVIDQTAAKRCACETHNPSGRCCLKDFR